MQGVLNHFINPRLQLLQKTIFTHNKACNIENVDKPRFQPSTQIIWGSEVFNVSLNPLYYLSGGAVANLVVCLAHRMILEGLSTLLLK